MNIYIHVNFGTGFGVLLKCKDGPKLVQTSVRWMVLWMRDGYCSLSSCLYIYFPASSQNNWFWHITTVLKIVYKKVKEPAKDSQVLCRLFHETISSVKVFEKTKTEDSLILKLFSKNWSRRFFDCDMFKEP